MLCPVKQHEQQLTKVWRLCSRVPLGWQPTRDRAGLASGWKLEKNQLKRKWMEGKWYVMVICHISSCLSSVFCLSKDEAALPIAVCCKGKTALHLVT